MDFTQRIFDFNISGFDDLALEIFNFQYENNEVYRAYCDTILSNISAIHSVEKIPFLPIQFFKSHEVKATSFEAESIFESSGTTQSRPSRHFVKNLNIYTESFRKTFGQFYGPATNWCILGLLPSYLERSNSSLVYMVQDLIDQSEQEESGFYLYDHEKLADVLERLESKKQNTILIGVSFALLDFAAKYSFPLKHTYIMETGGMKGRREEMTREQVHAILKEKFQVDQIHSEYGMTELLSQGYSKGGGIFHAPKWMKILIRDEDDPLAIKNFDSGTNSSGLSGIINVIDFANIYSCAFIATDDLGTLYPDGSFEVLGRIDNSDLRGCSLMVAEG
ncbi:MAG: acyl transferase [Bacteroidetes bacterium]|nr:MAG: acyl transferase [Bacteroidota bacterium]